MAPSLAWILVLAAVLVLCIPHFTEAQAPASPPSNSTVTPADESKDWLWPTH